MKSNWFMGKMSVKAFCVLCLSIVSLYFLWTMLYKVYDTDLYFIVASGREIIKNGFLYKNIWSIDGGAIVIQQWLYAVILAYVDRFGFIGYLLCFICQVSILCVLFWRFFARYSMKTSFRIFCMFVILMLYQAYLFSLRPELLTIILLISECLALERYTDTGSAKWLSLLPVLMLIEINAHGTMWFLHYALLLAYVMPNVLHTKCVDNHISLRDGKLWLAVLGMTVCLFANPYGMDMITYTVKAFRSHVFDYIYVNEVNPPEFLSVYSVGIFLSIVLCIAAYKVDVLRLVTLYVSIGLLFLAALYIRNNAFVTIVMLFVLRDLISSEVLQTRLCTINWQKDVLNYLYIVLGIIALFLFCAVGRGLTVLWPTTLYSNGAIFTEMDQYIRDHGNVETDRVFTGFNTGAFFEYCGYRNVYMDARPELYSKMFNGTKDVLVDYSKYCCSGGNRRNIDDIVSKDAMNEWFRSYDFDYVVVSVFTETYLHGYLDHASNYRLVPEASDNMYFLYEKVGPS